MLELNQNKKWSLRNAIKIQSFIRTLDVIGHSSDFELGGFRNLL